MKEILRNGFKVFKGWFKPFQFKLDWLIFLACFLILYGGTYLLQYSEDWVKLEEGERKWQRYRDIVVLTAGMVTLILTYWRSFILQKQTDNQSEQVNIQDRTRLDEQFKQAVEFLTKEDDNARTGAVFMLAALAKHSPEHTQRCLDMLCSLNEWMAERLEKESNYFRRYEKGKKIDKKTVWRDKIFTLDQASLDKYWRDYLRPNDSESAPTDETRKEARIHIAQERLSQLVIKEIEKIIAEVSEKKLSDKAFKKSYPQNLTLAQRFLPQINLSNLTLKKRFSFESAIMKGAYLRSAHLEGAYLRFAHLEGAHLWYAHLEGADLVSAHLEGADLGYAHLEGADLVSAHLEGADLGYAHLEGAHLWYAHLERANLEFAHLEGAHLWYAHLERANLKFAHLERAYLERANLVYAHLEGANLGSAHLEGAYLLAAHLEGAYLYDSDFKDVKIDKDTNFKNSQYTPLNMSKEVRTAWEKGK